MGRVEERVQFLALSVFTGKELIPLDVETRSGVRRVYSTLMHTIEASTGSVCGCLILTP